MHKLQLASVLAAGLLSAAAASADSVNLDFNGVTQYASVADFYNGGTDSAGASGAWYGVNFSASVLALTNDGLGSWTSGTPSNTVIFANAGDVPAVMNVNGTSGGFSDALTLSYFSTTAPTTVTIWSGLNDTGTNLGSFALSANNAWTTTSLTFSGIAQSVDFSSNAGNALFTNIGFAVPLPASGLLLSFGLGGLALFGVRRRAA